MANLESPRSSDLGILATAKKAICIHPSKPTTQKKIAKRTIATRSSYEEEHTYFMNKILSSSTVVFSLGSERVESVSP